MTKRKWLAVLLPWIALLPLCIALAALARPAVAADAVVQPPCNNAAFDTALAAVQSSGGGMLTFNCGASAVIVLSTVKTISTAVTVDGAGQVTLAGALATRLFSVTAAGRLTLRQLTLTTGYDPAGGNGGAVHNEGTLVVDQTTFTGNQTAVTGSGGAIVSYGPMTITNSLFDGNVAANGGALFIRYAPARTVISNTVFRHNQTTSPTDGWGGAILTWDGAVVTIAGGDIHSNTARTGGGIYNHAGTVPSTVALMAGALVRENLASAGNGGGIYSRGVLTLTGALLENNAAASGGGLYTDGPRATLTGVTLQGNSALAGGGVFANSGEVRLTDVTLSGNVADSRGGGIYNAGPLTFLTNVGLNGNTVTNRFVSPGASGGGLYNSGSVSLQNATLSGNAVMYGSGGGLYTVGTANLINVTLSGNSASYNAGGLGLGAGSALLSHVTVSGNSAGVSGGGLDRLGGTIAVVASIVADSPSGGNCGGTITNQGFNLSTDGTCGFNTAANLLLGPLADNGGPTPTHLPQPGSPAIDFVAVGCPPPATDQRGAPRPIDGDHNGAARCDAGAVEYTPALSKLYVPLIIR